MVRQKNFSAALITAVLLSVNFVARLALADAWDPPAAYYSGATSTVGATLKVQLQTAMTTGHILRTYGDFRDSAVIHDADPNNPGNILLAYTGESVSGEWDSGGTWDREHLWPDSQQPGNAGNGATGSIADPHALRPCRPLINSTRGNREFGFETNTGTHGAINTNYYFPGDLHKGDFARALFYNETRWSSDGLTLTDSNPIPSGSYMGDLSSLIAWHYLDAPDEFERRRNHTIYSQDYNPSYYTNNRNAYVDRPEFVWAIYKGNNNDSQITITGGTSGGNGATTRNVDLGRVFTGAALPANQSFTLNKGGDAGTYFEVTTSGQAFSSLSGRSNAFCMTSACAGQTTNKSITVGLLNSTSTAAAGLRSGTVTVNNLDITTGGGAGRGANDGNDVFNVSLTVLDHAQPSFISGATQLTKTIDFGNVEVGSLASVSFDVFNRQATAAFTANMDFDNIVSSGDTAQLTTNAASLAGSLVLAGGVGQSITAMLNTSATGVFSAAYTFNFSDENIAGALNKSITLNLMGTVRLAGDYNGDGLVDTLDYVIWRMSNGTSTAAYGSADGNGDTLVDEADFGIWSEKFGASAPAAGGGNSAGSAVPEPGTIGMVIAFAVIGVWRRGQRVPQI